MSGISDLQQRLEKAFRSIGTSAAPAKSDDNSVDRLALALCDIARHHGQMATRVVIIAGLPLVGGRLPLEHVEMAARRAGLIAELVKQDPLTLDDVELPAIALMRDGSADIIWAIERSSSGSALAVLASAPGNPEQRLRVPAGDVSSASDGRIIRLRPAAGTDERVRTVLAGNQAPWYLAAFSASRRLYADAIVATIVINVLALALPLFMMNVYDRVLPNAAAETLWSLSIGVALAIAFDFAIKLLRAHFVDAAGRRADVVLGNFIFGRLIGARLQGPVASAGVRASTMRELDTLREFYNSATLAAFGDLPFLLLFLLVIWAVGGALVIIPLLAIPLVLAISWMTQRAVGRMMQASVAQTAMKNAVVVETVAGLETIKAAGAESWAAAAWERASAESIRTGNAIKHTTNLGLFTVYAVQSLTQVAMIVVGFYMAAAGALTMGALIAATILAGRAMQPLTQMAHLITKLHHIRLSFRMLSEIVHAAQERPENAAFVARASIEGAIAFESVKFSYDKAAPVVLDDVSFSIAPGERIGLIGGIGTGKSTILRLVHGLRMPDVGRVLIDGVPTTQIDPAVLRSPIGLALQQSELFHGTIRNNITLAAPNVSDEALLEAARLSAALDWIVRLPRGFDTSVEERGGGLSGGQRQTIVLARALLQRPRVLLLDEPTSDFDTLTEQHVVERLKPFLKGRTTLIVTHRPAMLALVDRLIVLEGGRKRLDGPKAAVLASLAVASGMAAAKQEGAKS